MEKSGDPLSSNNGFNISVIHGFKNQIVTIEDTQTRQKVSGTIKEFKRLILGKSSKIRVEQNNGYKRIIGVGESNYLEVESPRMDIMLKKLKGTLNLP
ncbi:MAG: hypothetical protein PHE43_01040 [Candidatus Nanoarchaeia archaeon]|nr:hypothetical protein [Candidatus Nanoarchaeia archaeon]